jgi:glycosyltransferase involved in cell wall biosynthesis
MKIIVNGWYLKDKNTEGIGNFIYHSFCELARIRNKDDFYLLVPSSFPENFFIFPDNIKIIKFFPSKRNPLLYVPYFEYFIPSYLRKVKADLFIGPDGIISLTSRVKQISVIHDLAFVHRPHDLKLHNRLYYNLFFKSFARKAVRILTVSNFSKADICKNYGINSNKIDVVYCGLNDRFLMKQYINMAKTKSDFSDSEEYFLYVGSLNPRKNIEGAIKSYTVFRTLYPEMKHKLLIIGAAGWKTGGILDSHKNSPFKDDVRFVGRVTEDDLISLLSTAEALLFLSYFEGFGIPVIEAQILSCPVICSNKTSLPEVGNNSCIFVNPDDHENIAYQMHAISTNAILRKEIIELGYKNAHTYTWVRTANLINEAIQKLEKIIYPYEYK